VPRALRVLFTGSAFVLFAIGSAILGYTVLPLIGLTSRDPKERVRRRRRFMFIGYRFFAGYMKVLRLIDFDPPPVPAELEDGRAFIVIANHPTLIDVMLILAAIPGVSCLVKHKLFHSPFVGGLLRMAGYVPGPDMSSGTPEGTAVLDRMVEALEAGTPLLIFPEGTRSPQGGYMHRMRRGALEAAIRAKVRVFPVLFTCDPPHFLAKGQPWHDVPPQTARLEMTYLPIIDPASKGETSRAQTAALRQRYEALLSEFREGLDAPAEPARGAPSGAMGADRTS